MLQQISDGLKSHKWLMYTVFGALALIFAAWGAYGVANLNFGTSSYVAKVNGRKVSYDEIRPAWQRQQEDWQQRFGGDIPQGERVLLEDQLVESYIRDLLLTDRAHDLGYRVPEAELAHAVTAEPAFQLDGHYSADMAKARLQQAGISEEEYANDLRSDLERTQLETGLRISQFVTPTELARLRALNDQEREVRYAVLPLEKYSAAAQVTDAQVQAYYQAHQAAFMTTESVNLQYAQIGLQQVAAQVTVPEADVRDYYDKNKNRYISTEQRHAHHILVAVGGNVSDAAALKKAQDIDAKLKAGGNFEALAKQYSDDAGSASKGGDLDTADRSSFPTAFGDALFKMKVGEISAPVKADDGYHIIRLDSIVPARGKTFEEARADVEAQIKHDRAADKFGDLQEQIQQKLEQSGGGETLAALAKEFGLTLGDVPDYLKGAGGGDIGNSKDLQDAVFSDAVLGEHRIGGPVLVGDNELVLVKALSHQAPAPKPLASVRDGIVAILRKEQGTQAAVAAADAAVKRLQSGADFDAVSKELGVTTEAAKFIGRQDPSVPAQVREQAFDAARPAEHQAVYKAFEQTGGGAVVLAVLAVRTPPQAADPEEEAALQRNLSQQYGDEDAQDYLEQARSTAKVQKNLALLDQ